MKLALHKKILVIILSVALLSSLFIGFFGCNRKVEYETDELNERGTSVWSQLPFVTAEAKALGYYGGEACQHLNSVARAHGDKNIMFFGTDASGMSKSTDGGKTWVPCNYGIYTSGVCRIEVDPFNDNHVVIVNASGSETTSRYSSLMYSFDCGETWTKSEGTRGIGFAACQYYYDTLEFDPASYDENLGYCTDVYFCTPYERDDFPSLLKNNSEFTPKRGMYKSSDGGQSFTKVDNTEDLADGIISFDNGVFAVANGHGIWVKNGNKFVKRSDIEAYTFECAAGKYYVLCEDGIYTSTNLSSFTKIQSDNFPARLPRNLAVSAKNPDRMVLFARKKENNKYSQRPYYSHDGGKTWTLTEPEKNEELFYYYTFHNGTFSFDPDDENVIIGIIGGEVIKSQDGGASFTYSGSGISNVTLGGFFNFNIYDSNLLYSGAYDFGGALTTDGGKTWKNVSLSKDGDGKDIMGGYAADENTLFGVYVEKWNDGTYFANRRYVCFSHDGGKTVNIQESVIESYPEKNPDPKDDPYADLNVDHTIGTSYESSYQSPNNRKILFCANFRSTDNGYTWVNMQTASKGEKCLQVLTHCGKTLYGCSKQSGFVLKSNDDGKTWEKVNGEELPKSKINSPSHVTDIAVDGVNGYIYAAYGNHLFRMRTDGTEIKDLTVGMVKDNFNTYRIRTVAIDPNQPQIVYCGGSGDFYMNSDSVRRSCDFGETWYTVTKSSSSKSIVKDGLPLGLEARCLRVRPDGTLWCGTLCMGYCTLTPPYTVKKK